MRSLIVMFDLESTIINSWNSGVPYLSKIRTINQRLATVHITACGIFSYAIDFEHEKPQGINLAEIAMGRPIDRQFVPCYKELENCLPFDTGSLSKRDIVHIYGKSIMFPRYCLQFPGHDFILFDDALAFSEETIQRTVGKNTTQTITMVRV